MRQFREVELPQSVYRVGRQDNPVNFSTITPADATLPRAGNRYDVPGGRCPVRGNVATGVLRRASG